MTLVGLRAVCHDVKGIQQQCFEQTRVKCFCGNVFCCAASLEGVKGNGSCCKCCPVLEEILNSIASVLRLAHWSPAALSNPVSLGKVCTDIDV